MRSFLAAAGLSACLVRPTYTPGALTDPSTAEGRSPSPWNASYANTRRVSECLDLAAWAIASREVWPRVLLRVDIGNRCDSTIDVDFTALRVTATCGAGEVTLSPYDPHHVIEPGRLAPHDFGAELIAFGSPDCPSLPSGVCADMSHMVKGKALSEAEERICFPDREALVR
jgi:hypothetical protein